MVSEIITIISKTGSQPVSFPGTGEWTVKIYVIDGIWYLYAERIF